MKWLEIIKEDKITFEEVVFQESKITVRGHKHYLGHISCIIKKDISIHAYGVTHIPL